LGKSVHLKRPGRGQISGFGLPLTAVTKNKITKTFWASLGQFGQNSFAPQKLGLLTNLWAKKRFLSRRKQAKFWVRALDSPHKHQPIQTIDVFVQNPTNYFADIPEKGVIKTTKRSCHWMI